MDWTFLHARRDFAIIGIQMRLRYKNCDLIPGCLKRFILIWFKFNIYKFSKNITSKLFFDISAILKQLTKLNVIVSKLFSPIFSLSSPHRVFNKIGSRTHLIDWSIFQPICSRRRNTIYKHTRARRHYTNIAQGRKTCAFD